MSSEEDNFLLITRLTVVIIARRQKTKEKRVDTTYVSCALGNLASVGASLSSDQTFFPKLERERRRRRSQREAGNPMSEKEDSRCFNRDHCFPRRRRVGGREEEKTRNEERGEQRGEEQEEKSVKTGPGEEQCLEQLNK